MQALENDGGSDGETCGETWVSCRVGKIHIKDSTAIVVRIFSDSVFRTSFKKTSLKAAYIVDVWLLYDFLRLEKLVKMGSL